MGRDTGDGALESAQGTWPGHRFAVATAAAVALALVTAGCADVVSARDLPAAGPAAPQRRQVSI